MAPSSKDGPQSRCLLALALVKEGMSRGEAARRCGMDRQTLRNWVHRFNAEDPEGLRNRPSPGPACRLTTDQLAELARWVEAGPDLEADGVVRWRCTDLSAVGEVWELPIARTPFASALPNRHREEY